MEIKITLCIEECTLSFLKDKLGRIEGLLNEIKHKQNTQEAKMAELDDDVQAVVDGVSKVSDQIVDLKTDFDAAIAKLQTGTPIDPATLQKLKDVSTKLGTMSDALVALDTTAEGISGTPTP